MRKQKIRFSALNVLRPLVSPDTAFTDASWPAMAPWMLFLALFLIFTAGVRLQREFYSHSAVTALEIQQLREDVERSAIDASQSQKTMMLRSRVPGVTGGGSPVREAVATALPGAFFLLYVLEIWAFMVLMAQFLGGDEEPWNGRTHRRSLLLTLYVFLPLALRKFGAGSFLWLQNRSYAWNAASLEAYRSSTEASFSLFRLLDLSILPPVIRMMLVYLGDPFLLWAGLILLLGFPTVFRVPWRKGLYVLTGMLFLLAVNAAFLGGLSLYGGSII